MDEDSSIDATVAMLSEPPRSTPPTPSPVWFSIDTDVSLGGSPAREWLVASASGLAVAAVAAERGGRVPAAVIRHVPWSSIERIRTAAGVGGGMLQVREGGDWIDLLRYSNALATRFHKIARALEAARDEAEQKERPVCEPADASRMHAGESMRPVEVDPPSCPTCSLRLVNTDDACPRCMQKGRILSRVSELIAPHARGAWLLVLLTLVGVVAELVPPKLQQYMVDDILSSAGAAEAGGSAPDFKTALLVVVLALAASRVMLSLVAV
ncbi:MAG: hypothetical protein ACKOEX_13635, partial [Planctomycetia bacterium]